MNYANQFSEKTKFVRCSIKNKRKQEHCRVVSSSLTANDLEMPVKATVHATVDEKCTQLLKTRMRTSIKQQTGP